MILKVNLRARNQELTAHVELTNSGQRRCASGRCRNQGVGYTLKVKDLLAQDGQQPTQAVAREARRILRQRVGPPRGLCPKHFGTYLARITDLGDTPVEIVET
jgi:hypothetical protein